ncbi:MAG TPA: hypothetical protein PLN65_00010 [Enterococcus sp.]|nr:hypothetical protein [Enterococcus sp.]
MKKIVIPLIITLFLLVGCSGSSVKIQPSVNLPYEISNKESVELKDEGLEYYTDYQVLENITIRELTNDENEVFLKKMKDNTLNTLNSEYSAIEFDFGRTERIDRINRTIYKFDEETSKFIYDDQILNVNFYQIATKEKIYLEKFNEETQEDIVYGEVSDDFRIVTLIETEFIKKGLQFKTTINDKVVYIDIE